MLGFLRTPAEVFLIAQSKFMFYDVLKFILLIESQVN